MLPNSKILHKDKQLWIWQMCLEPTEFVPIVTECPFF